MTSSIRPHSYPFPRIVEIPTPTDTSPDSAPTPKPSSMASPNDRLLEIAIQHRMLTQSLNELRHMLDAHAESSLTSLQPLVDAINSIRRSSGDGAAVSNICDGAVPHLNALMKQQRQVIALELQTERVSKIMEDVGKTVLREPEGLRLAAQEKSELQGRIEELNRTLVEMKKKDQRPSAPKRKDEKERELKSQIDALTSQLGELKDEVKTSRSRATSMASEATLTEGPALRAQISELNTQIGVLSSRSSTLDTLENKLEGLSQENKRLSGMLLSTPGGLGAEVVDPMALAGMSLEEIRDLKQKLGKGEEEMKRLNEKVEELEGVNKKLSVMALSDKDVRYRIKSIGRMAAANS